MLTHGELFAGIGGFGLGFARAGIKTVWQVENDPYAVKVLERHWPDATRYDDITKIDFCWNRYSKRKFVDPEPVDILSGGFPCQDVSYAGKRKGLHRGTRSRLWLHFFRAIRQLRPRYVVVENVPGLFSLGFGDVLGDLAAVGYNAEWEELSAAAFGALHLRARLFLVAYPSSMFGCGGNDNTRVGVGGEPLSELGNDCGAAAIPNSRSGGRRTGERDVLPGQSDAIRGGADVADADGPRPQGRDGEELRERAGEQLARAGGSPLADADGNAERAGPCEGEPRTERGRRPGDGGGAVPDADEFNADDGRFGASAVFEQDATGIPKSEYWRIEPDVGRVAYGVPARVDRLRTLGNAVVPQITEWLGRKIIAHAKETRGEIRS